MQTAHQPPPGPGCAQVKRPQRGIRTPRQSDRGASRRSQSSPSLHRADYPAARHRRSSTTTDHRTTAVPSSTRLTSPCGGILRCRRWWNEIGQIVGTAPPSSAFAPPPIAPLEAHTCGNGQGNRLRHYRRHTAARRVGMPEHQEQSPTPCRHDQCQEHSRSAPPASANHVRRWLLTFGCPVVPLYALSLPFVVDVGPVRHSTGQPPHRRAIRTSFPHPSIRSRSRWFGHCLPPVRTGVCRQQRRHRMTPYCRR